MKTSIRVHSLTLSGAGAKSLATMEKHGRRQDATSQHRKINDTPPLVYKGLNLRELFDNHVDNCRMNKGLKRPVLHALIQFPTELTVNKKNEQAMMKAAIDFINSTHGGNAVFAARLDRDEQGKHSVDVFYSPKFEKTNVKRKSTETWISTTKFAKSLCKKHEEEIKRRHGGKFVDGPRQQGIALQAELHNYLLEKGLNLNLRQEKTSALPDRLDPEDYKLKADLDKREQALAEKEAAFEKAQKKSKRGSARDRYRQKRSQRLQKTAQSRLRAANRRLNAKRLQEAPEAVYEPRELSSRELWEQKQETTYQKTIKRIAESKIREIKNRNSHDPQTSRSPSM